MEDCLMGEADKETSSGQGGVRKRPRLQQLATIGARIQTRSTVTEAYEDKPAPKHIQEQAKARAQAKRDRRNEVSP